MHQPVNPLFDAHKDSEIRNVTNRSHDPGAFGILVLEKPPGIGFGLLQPQRNALVFHIQVQYGTLDHVSHREDLGRMSNLLDPGHFRNMDQTFDPFLQGDKSTVIGQTDHLALNNGSHRVFLRCRIPGIIGCLFEPE